MFPRDRGSELVDHGVAPLGALELLADVLADLPVEAHQLRADGLVRRALRGLDEREVFVERGDPRERRGLCHRW